MNTNQKDKEFIDQNMYHNKSSKSVWTPTIWGCVICLCLVLFGVYQWYSINQWEMGGGTYRMRQSIWTLYKWGGKNLVAGIFIGVGIMALIKGYMKTNQLKKLANKDVIS